MRTPTEKKNANHQIKIETLKIDNQQLETPWIEELLIINYSYSLRNPQIIVFNLFNQEDDTFKLNVFYRYTL